MRTAFSRTLTQIALNDSKVLLLTGDHGYALFDEFRQACPDQFINAGIAEQNMIGVAAGLARVGYKPYVYGLSAFVPIRVIEQIKIDLAHDRLPVVLLGDGAGFVYSHLGTSHQSTEDIASLRAIPDLQIYSPADRFELEHCFALSTSAQTTTYIRVGKADRGDVHTGPVQATQGDMLPVRDGGGELLFIATGSMVRTALDVAQTVFPQATVWSVPFIKPLNIRQVVEQASKARWIVCLEEHSVFGGLGSVLSEITSEHMPKHVLRIGVEDRFSQHCGSYEYLLKEHGLDKQSVAERVQLFLSQSP